MCGLAGIVSHDPAAGTRVPAMVRSLRHRGPDDEGIEYLGEATLGHRRLSILDLAGGHQPMRSADGQLAVAFNGEIYNYPALRRALEAEGRQFRTRADTEILLHLYEKYGADCVAHLDGMFAFAIWDAPRRRLLLARDHLGQKPLFYARTARGLVFASEVKAVLESGLISREPNLEALYHYISLRFIPDRLTLFNGVEKLPAAHRLVYEDGVARVERYWSFSCLPKQSGTEAELTDALDRRLRETVRAHLLSDVPVGSFLSGGIDSSLITALMAQESAGPVPTFSIGVPEQGFSELPWAAQVAQRYGTSHHEEVVTAALVHLLPQMVWHLDEPADPYGAGVYLVSRLAARHVKVVLSGDGGDELFAGYDRFAGQRLATIYAALPAGLRRTLMRRLIGMVPESFGYKSLAQKLHWLNEMSLLDAGERYAASMSFLRFTEDAKRSLLTPGAREILGAQDSTDKILEHFDSPNASDLVDRMLYTDLVTRIPDHLLPIVDRMAMAHGLEVRAPMLEHRLVEFGATLPAELKLRGTKLKYILRRVAARYLPAELIDRPKQGFGFPLAHWMRRELGPLLREAVRTSRFVDSGVFDRRYMEALVTEHVEGRRDHNFRLWILLNLEIWHRLTIEEQSVEATGEWIRASLSGPRTLILRTRSPRTPARSPKRKPRVGIMLRHIHAPGGMNVINRRLIPYLAEHLGEFEYHLLYSKPDQQKVFADVPATPVVLPSRSRAHWDQVLVPRYAREAGLDLVVNGKFSIPVACPAPTISFIPGPEQLAVPWIFPWHDRHYNRVMLPVYCRSAAAIVTCTELGKRDLVRLTGADPDRIHVVPLGVDPWFQPADDASKQSLRERYHLPNPYVLFLGGISPLKNVGNLLRAFARLPAEPALDLVIAGFNRWRFEGELGLIRTLGLEPRVRQIGFVPDADMAALYSAAHCYVLPSWYEGFGIPVLEAMACGCPVVTSTDGCSPEVAGGAATLADPASPEAIAEAIRTVVYDPAVRRRQISAGVAQAARFDWDATNRMLADLIQSIVGSPPSVRRPRLAVAALDGAARTAMRGAAMIAGVAGV